MESGRADACAASARAIAGLLGWSPATRVDVPHLPESLSYESKRRRLSRVGESPIARNRKFFLRRFRQPTLSQWIGTNGDIFSSSCPAQAGHPVLRDAAILFNCSVFTGSSACADDDDRWDECLRPTSGEPNESKRIQT